MTTLVAPVRLARPRRLRVPRSVLIGAAGAGGVALQVWALTRSGISSRAVAARMVAFLVLLYSFYAVTVATVGLGLWSGVLPGGGSALLTIVPGVLALALIGGALGGSR